MGDTKRLLYCHCAHANVVPKAVKEQVLTELAASGCAFEAVGDLCELSARKDPCLKQLADGGPVQIVACYPRAVKWLFAAAGAPLPAQGVEVLNMRTETAETIVGAVLAPKPTEGNP
jgi:hypothetical protein